MNREEQEPIGNTPPQPFRALSTDVEELLSGVRLDDTAALTGEGNTVAPTPVVTPPAVVEERVLREAERSNVRVLMLTYDDVLSEGSAAQREAIARGALFEEVHIIVFTTTVYSYTSLKLSDNVFAYPTCTTKWWRYPLDAYRIAQRQLFFAGTFRADVIAADDPFELGLTAWAIALRFKRALHLTVSVDPDSKAYLDDDPSNQYRLLISRFIIGRASRVRALTATIARAIEERYSHLTGAIDTIPRFIDVSAYASAVPTFNLHERHSGFGYIMLLYGPLDVSQNAVFALDAAQHALRQYGSVALVVVGEGPDASLLKARAKEKGIEHKVFFEDVTLDRASCLKTADTLLVLSATPHEEMLLAAAASGVPVITVHSPVADSLFEDGQSGIVCAPGDLGCVIKGINTYMGDSGKRTHYATAAREHVVRTMGDATVHHELIRETILRALESYTLAHGTEAMSDASVAEAEIVEDETGGTPTPQQPTT